MYIGAKIFVAIIFILLSFLFFTPIMVLYYEFGENIWWFFATKYSHLFIYFPTFGLVVLFSFYLPTAALVDYLWRHLRLGRLIFFCGLPILVVLSTFTYYLISSDTELPLFSLKRHAIVNDNGTPENCGNMNSCNRASYSNIINQFQNITKTKNNLRAYIRNCYPDPTLEVPYSVSRHKLCFVTGENIDAEKCCRAQSNYVNSISSEYSETNNHSLTYRILSLAFPFEIFFMYVIFLTGIFLLLKRSVIDQYYYVYTEKIEKLVIIGIMSALLWPIMGHASSLASKALAYSTTNFDGGFNGFHTFIWTLWASGLFLIFFRRVDRHSELHTKYIVALILFAFFIVYDFFIDLAISHIGAGASINSLIFITCSALILLSISIRLLINANSVNESSSIPVSNVREKDIGNLISAERDNRKPQADKSALNNRIFISYRRDDSADITDRIFEHLEKYFGSGFAFKDVDSIPIGEDFDLYIQDKVDNCDVVLAVIGPDWLNIRNPDADRRIDEPNDLVRIEIESGLKSGTPLVPLLVGGAKMPKPEYLPPSIERLAYKTGLEIRRDPDFKNDVQRLIHGLERDERIAQKMKKSDV